MQVIHDNHPLMPATTKAVVGHLKSVEWAIDTVEVDGYYLKIDLVDLHGTVTVNMVPPAGFDLPCWDSYLAGTTKAEVMQLSRRTRPDPRQPNYVAKILEGVVAMHRCPNSEAAVVHGLKHWLTKDQELPFETGLTGFLCDVARLLWEHEEDRKREWEASRIVDTRDVVAAKVAAG